MTRRELTDEQIEAKFFKGKAGRKPTPAAQPVPVVVNAQVTAQELVAVDGLAQLQASYGQGRDLVNQLLGQAQAFQAAGNLLQTFGVSKLALVKENKLYQQLSGMKTPNGLELKGTWNEFCQLLGMSDEKANQDIANLKAFGEEALEQMQRIGIGYRELRQYRKLPEDQKLALIEVAKAGDKEGFVELAEEIIAKHAKEKETLAAQVEETKATLQAKDRVLQTRAELIGKLEEQVARRHKFTPRPGSVARTQAEDALLKEVFTQSLRVNGRMRALFVAVDGALSDSGGNAPEAVQQAARAAVQYLAQQFADVAQEFGIAIDLDERIEAPWTAEDEAALQALAAKNAAEDKAAHRPTR
ncbi:MAG: hypothetical protein ACT4NV_18010 [Rhodoferax sp.]